MSRQERFTFLCNENERQLISALSEYFQRSQSDAVRFLIREAVQRLLDDSENKRQIMREVQNEK